MNARAMLNLPVLDAGQIGGDGGSRLRGVRAGSEVALPISASHMREAQPSEGGSGGKAGQVAWLSADIARCCGKGHDSPGGVVIAVECIDCRRRTDPPHQRQVWTGPSDESPCPMRIAP